VTIAFAASSSTRWRRITAFLVSPRFCIRPAPRPLGTPFPELHARRRADLAQRRGAALCSWVLHVGFQQCAVVEASVTRMTSCTVVRPFLTLRMPSLAQADHAALEAQAPELGDVGVSGDDVAQLVVDDEEFVDADAPGVAGLAALVAALGHPHLLSVSRPCMFEELGHFLGGELLDLAMDAEAPDEALGEHGVDRGADEEGLQPDVDQAGDRARRVVGVQGREHEVPVRAACTAMSRSPCRGFRRA
jgi:hypothetical protein